MPKLPLRYYCYVCGHTNDLKLNVPLAPKIERDACPKCEGAFRYYLSDLDFPQEIVSLAEAYVKLLTGVRDSLKDHIKEFNVPVPKKWSVNLKCECGEEYTAEIPLPQLSG